MRVISVGDSCIDLYERLDIWYPTGNCVDFAVNLRKFGVETAIITAAGNDQYGEAIIDALKRYHVDISHVHRDAGQTAVTQMDMNGNDRVHLEWNEGVLANFSLARGDIEYIGRFDLLHTVLWGKIDQHLQAFKQKGLSIVYDFCLERDKEKVKNILPHVNYAFFSYDRKDQSIQDFLQWAYSFGLDVAIATLGENGSLAYDGKMYYEQGIVPVKVKNTVGAGDSFIAGYVYGLSRRASIQECLQFGAEIAAQVIQKFEPF